MDEGQGHLSLLEKSSWGLASDVQTDIGWLTSTWSDDTDPHLVLCAKPYLMKNKYLTRELYHTRERDDQTGS